MDEGKAMPKVSWKRIGKFYLWFFLAVASLVPILGVVVVLADFIHWHNVRREFLQDSSLKDFPQPLPDASLAATRGITTVTESGCSIDLPSAGATVRSFIASLPDGRGVFFEDPARATDDAAVFRGASGGSTAAPVLGDSTLQSNYNFLSAELNFGSADAGPWPYGAKHTRAIFLGIRKSLDVEMYKSQPIYRVAFGDIRGFQFGDPNLGSGTVELRMFDSSDRQFRVNFFLQSRDLLWTQPEINFIVHSMRCDDNTYNAARQAWDAKIHPSR